ncbi:fam-a protein [Plasmodium vinckei lentum]|uniref:Fam-a protein n=1 Tax=Plasmodium vinckei lentum TaxID=138297 RepID=A0A6V7SKX0_PLAVN|nr:fam-a protein [Plasmodium vinckei lentum]
MNKGYIKIALALLSVVGYMQNIAFAINSISNTNSSNEKAKQQLPINHEEAKQATDIMTDVLNLARKHIEHTDDYMPFPIKDEEEILYFKKVNNTYIGMIELTIPNPDSYDGIINMLWDSNGEKNFDYAFIKGNISKIYDKNLVIRQQRYKGFIWNKYYNALANKVELSKDETAIVLASSDMNDHNRWHYKEYVNPIVESANSFKPDIDSEEIVRNGITIRMYVNLVAFFIKKEADCVKITHVASFDHNDILQHSPKSIIKMTGIKLINIIKLKDIFKKE